MSDGIPANKFIVSRPVQENVTALAVMQKTVNLTIAGTDETILVDAYKVKAEPGLDGFSIAASDMQNMLVGPDIFYHAIPVQDRLVFPNSHLVFHGRGAESARQIFRNVFAGYISFALESTELKNFYDLNCYTKELTPVRDYKVEALVDGKSYGVRLLDGEEVALEIKTGLTASLVNALICGVESSIDSNMSNVQGGYLQWEFLEE